MLKIFIAQYISILLLGIQSLNVRDSKYLSSAITSLLLGVFGWHTTGIVAQAYGQGMDSVVFWAFILAGPCGIVSSMALYDYMFKQRRNK
jgi:uncharacterized membrane protein YuzA (DUF378 family)